MRLSFRRFAPWLSALLLLVALSMASTPLQAQAPALALDVQPLYGGTVKYGEWLPIRVEVENQGEAQSGQLRIPVVSASGTHYHAQQVELAAGARKAVTIPVTVRNTARRLTVEWLPDGATEATTEITVEIDAVPNIRLVVAALTSGGEGLSALDNASFEGIQPARDVVVVPLDLESVPERADLLGTLDMMALSGVDTGLFTPAQRQALESFVARGGVLVIGGGPEAARVLGGLPESLRPVSLTGEQALEALPALGQWGESEVRVSGPFSAAVGTPVAGAATRLEQDALPLVVERAHGAGTVYWLALDPALSPFDAWAGVDRFWERLLGDRIDFPSGQAIDVSPRQQLQQDMSWLLRELPVLDLPSLRLLAPMLLVYILVVGPLNYLFLRRRGRLEWAWATIPLATLVFSAGAYGLGFQLRGSDVILNTVSLAQAAPGNPTATVYGTVGLFSPANRTYTLSVAGEALVSIIDQSDPWGGPRTTTTDGLTILNGEPTRITEFQVPQWEMHSLGMEGQWQIGGSVSADLVVNDDLITGTLYNESDLILRDAILVMRTYFVRLGDVAPGQRVEVNFPLTREDGDAAVTSDLGWRIFEQEGGMDRTTEVRRRLFALALDRSMAPVPVMPMEAPMAMNDVSPLLRTATLRLIAWPDEAPLPVALSPQGNESQVNTTMLVLPLHLQFVGGSVNTPEGYLAGAVVEQEGGSVCYWPAGDVPSLTPDYRSAIIEWQLPDELRAMSVTSLSLSVWTDLPDQDDPALTASLFDHTNQIWTPIELDPVVRVTEGARFVSAEGVVRLRAENEDINVGGCHFFDLRVAGDLLTEAGT